MKNLLLISSALLFVLSCSQESGKRNQNCCLANDDSLKIVKEIFAVSDNWAFANINMDAEKAAEFWDSSSNFLFVENGEQILNWDSLFYGIKNWYSQPLDSIELRWEERKVIPLTHEAATLFCKFYFRARFKTGELYHSRAFITALFVKKDGKWKLMQGHESYKVLGKE